VSKCIHWWMTVVPKEGKCFKRCTKCGKEKRAGCNGG
jgi:hypothetical protein